MAEKWYLRYRVHIIVLLALGCFYGVGKGNVYGFSIFPDEFTYWSYAAKIAGYDWSDIISLGSYYSYGYSLVLLPVFLLCKASVTAYRIACGINFMLLFFSFAHLARAMRKLFPDENIPIEIFSGLAILFPGNLFYAQMTMTEILLVFIYVLEGELLWRYLNNNRKLTLCVLITLLMYSYMVHMRTVGILISAVGVLIIHMWSKTGKRHHILVMAGMFLLLFAAEHILKDWAFHNVYGNAGRELIRGNDYGGQLDKIRYVFTAKGMYDVVISIWGKFLYLGLATCGLFYWGMIAMTGKVRGIIAKVKDNTEITVMQKFSVFILLSVAAQILIATIYLLTLGEISDYTYGRYTELIIPFIVVFGAVELWKEKTGRVIAITGIMAAIQLAGIALVVRQIWDTGAEGFHGFFMIGISYLYNESNFDISDFYKNSYLFCEALTVLIVLFVFFCRSGKKRYCFLIWIVVLELALSARANHLFLHPLQRAAFRDGRMAEKIEAMWEKGHQVIYIDNVFPVYAGILQFLARDIDIRVIKESDAADYKGEIAMDAVVILAFDSENVQKWTESFSHAYTYGHFTLLYND